MTLDYVFDRVVRVVLSVFAMTSTAACNLRYWDLPPGEPVTWVTWLSMALGLAMGVSVWITMNRPPLRKNDRFPSKSTSAPSVGGSLG